MKTQKIIFGNKLTTELEEILSEGRYSRLFVLADSHTSMVCLPLIDSLKSASFMTIPAGEANKNLNTLAAVWKWLSDNEATRYSLLINLGGGMVTDLGGFAAATFKRGIRYFNIPTTLLAMVDASIGGKTGIDFNGLKNEIGAFAPAEYVWIDTRFLETLDNANLFSGYAEMLKHGLLSDDNHWAELLNLDLFDRENLLLRKLVEKSVRVKQEVVEKDPYEKGIRKALNFGHTVGHAFESLALRNAYPVLHGYAVAWGMVCELYLSHLKAGFPKEKLRQMIGFVKKYYGLFAFDCRQYEALYELMMHDKKNIGNMVNFTLLKDIGIVETDHTADKEEIFEMFDFYRECMGC